MALGLFHIPKALVVTLLFAGVVGGAGQISGPTVGYLLGTSGDLLPILGIPGSSHIAEPLAIDKDLHITVVSSEGNYAFAFLKDQDLVLLSLSRIPTEVVSLGVPIPDRIELSRTGSAAALYYERLRRIQVFTALPDSPRLISEWDVSTLPESLTFFAVADDGSRVVAAFAEGETTPLFRFSVTDGARFVSRFGKITALAFGINNKGAFVADETNKQVTLIRDIDVDNERHVIADESNGLSGPIAMGISDNDSRVFVANAGRDNILVIDLPAGTTKQLRCECRIRGLYRMRERSVFLLTHPQDGPLMIIDGAGEEPNIYFIPTAR